MKHLICTLASLVLCFSSVARADQACHELQNYSATKLRSSNTVDFCAEFKGKPMLLVNTASECGSTPQFRSLEALHKKYGEKIAIVGFPSNDFKQEHADSEKVAEVCYLNYGVTFTMLEPSQVTGEGANALFAKLAKGAGKEPEWNFNKYLVSADGETIKHFSSNAEPGSAEFIQEVEKVIGL